MKQLILAVFCLFTQATFAMTCPATAPETIPTGWHKNVIVFEPPAGAAFGGASIDLKHQVTCMYDYKPGVPLPLMESDFTVSHDQSSTSKWEKENVGWRCHSTEPTACGFQKWMPPTSITM